MQALNKGCAMKQFKGKFIPDIRHHNSTKTFLLRPKTAFKHWILGHLTNRNILLYLLKDAPKTGNSTGKTQPCIIRYPSFQRKPHINP
jgi:hypothetical protein